MQLRDMHLRNMQLRNAGLAAALAALAALGPAAGAQATNAGQPVHDFGGEWFNHRQTTMGGLLGRVVYVEFWGEFLSDSDRDRVSEVRRLHRKYGDSGLVPVVVSAADREKIVEKIEEWWIDFPVLRLDREAQDAIEEKYGVKSSYPHGALITHLGILEWRGSARGLPERRVPDMLEHATIIPRLPAAFERINAAISFDHVDYAKAYETIEREHSRSPDDPHLDAAMKAVRAIFDADYGECERLIGARDFGVAYARLEKLEQAWRGSDPSKEAKERARLLRADPAAKDDIRAYGDFVEADEYTRIRKFSKARPLYERIVERYPGTKCAERSAKALQEIHDKKDS